MHATSARGSQDAHAGQATGDASGRPREDSAIRGFKRQSTFGLVPISSAVVLHSESSPSLNFQSLPRSGPSHLQRPKP